MARRSKEIPEGATHKILRGTFAYLDGGGRGEFRNTVFAEKLSTRIRNCPGYKILEGAGFTRFGSSSSPCARVHGLLPGTRVGIPGSRGVRKIEK